MKPTTGPHSLAGSRGRVGFDRWVDGEVRGQERAGLEPSVRVRPVGLAPLEHHVHELVERGRLGEARGDVVAGPRVVRVRGTEQGVKRERDVARVVEAIGG